MDLKTNRNFEKNILTLPQLEFESRESLLRSALKEVGRYSEAKYSNCHLGKGVLDYLFSEIKETLQVHEHEHLRWLHLFRKNEATAVYTEPGLLYT